MGQELLTVAASLHGSVAEWSKALVLGTSLFGGVGSNPTAATILMFHHPNVQFARIYMYI